MSENPLKPQIPYMKAKGVTESQLSQLYSVLTFFFFFFPPGLAPSVKITRYGYLRHLQYIKISYSMK